MFNSKLLSKLVLSTALAFSAAAVVSVMPTTAEAQAISGDIVGLVTDASGAVVPNAAVEVANIATGQKAKTTTNAAGEYRFGNLPVGQYNIQVSGAGMQGGSKGVLVQLNKTATANIVAAVGASATTIEVTEAAAAIDTTTAQIQSNFEAKQVQDLPTASVGLGVLNLSLLSAGVASSGGMGAGTGPSVSGQRPRNNNYTVEGVDNNDKSVTGPLVTIPNDAIENFTLMQNQFSPEFGHSSGGQFNQVVKGGTNQFHGRAYEYFQNRNLNAQDSIVAKGQRANGLNPSTTRYDDNRFGGQIGGPIIKDKLFFFHNSEYNPRGEALTSNAYAPTAAGYTTLAAQASAGKISATNFGIMQKYLPAALTSNGTTTLVNGVAIPVGDVSFSGSNYKNTYTTVNSVDYNVSQKDQLRFRYIYSHGTQLDHDAQLPAFWTTLPTRNHVVTFSEYHTFSPKINNEFRLGYNRSTSNYSIPNIQFPGLAQFPNISLDDLNGVNIGPNPNAPQWGYQNTYQLTDNLSWSLGSHNLKLGFEARKYISPSHFVQRERGDYYYATTEEFLLDQAPSDLAERSTGNTNYIADQYALYGYANDEWRINQHLSLSLGLRYEFTSVPEGLKSQALNSAASVPNLISFSAPTAQKKNFAPRVGFAYSPGTSGDTSIRGGFGIAYDVLYDNLGTLSLPPQLSGTCDVGGSSTSSCYWNGNAFLANGGLPQTAGATTTFPTVLDQRQATASYVPNQKLPYTETWNLGIQHVFAKKYIADVRYVGTRGIHLPVQDRLNRQSKVSATNYLPTFLNTPTPAQIAALTTTLSGIMSGSNYVPAYANAGFDGSSVVGFMPYGQSSYHGLQTQLTRNFTNGLQLQAAWTWSHAFDNSTADVFSTLLTPRRPQDFQNINGDMSTSALDRRHRLTISAIYDLPFFQKNSNWFVKNLAGNWEIAPVYTFQSPEYATVQSATDSNLNGDAWGDRAIYNANGTPGVGSGVKPVTNSSGQVVAYQAINPNAQYIVAGAGALATAGRNTLPMPRTNNWDLTLVKKFKVTETQQIEFQAQAFNLFNHAQYLPGSLNQVDSLGYTGGNERDLLTPGKLNFNRPQEVFSNNPRTMVLVLKYSF